MDEQYDAYLNLWSAVIQLAVADIRAFRKSGRSTAEAKKDYRDAHAWVFSDSPDVYSFTWACDMLSIDIKAVREVCRG